MPLVGWSLGVLKPRRCADDGDEKVAGLVMLDNSAGEEPGPTPCTTPQRPSTAARHRDGPLRRRHVSPRPSKGYAHADEATLHTPSRPAGRRSVNPCAERLARRHLARKPVLYVARAGWPSEQAANLGAQAAGT